MTIDANMFFDNTDHPPGSNTPDRLEHSTLERNLFPKMVQDDHQRAQQGQQRQPQQQPRNAEPLTDADRAKVMYQDSPIYNDSAQETVNVLIETGQYTPEEAAEIFTNEYEPLARQLELNATQTKAATEAILGAWKTPATAELVESWTEKSLENVKAEYGVANAASALRDARQLVASIPELYVYLEENNLGSHPVLVNLLCQRARAMRQAGKLK